MINHLLRDVYPFCLSGVFAQRLGDVISQATNASEDFDTKTVHMRYINYHIIVLGRNKYIYI